MAQIGQLIILGTIIGSIYSLMALGFVLIYKCSKVLNFAQGELVMLGGYILITVYSWGLGIWPTLILTVGICFIFGFILERLALRPLIEESPIAIIMATIAISVVLKGVAPLVWGPIERAVPSEIFIGEAFDFAGVTISPVYMWGFALAIGLCTILILFFHYTKTGLAMQAVSEDVQVARSTGVKAGTIIGLTWAISAGIAAVAALALGGMAWVGPVLSHLGLKAIAVVILGGFESIPGALIAGILIGILENFAGAYLDPLIWGGGVKSVFPYVIALFVLIIRPYGLFGLRRIERI